MAVKNLKFLVIGLIILFLAHLLVSNYLEDEIILASPETFEIEGWQTADFIPKTIWTWDNPPGIEGVNNSGVASCWYRVYSRPEGAADWGDQYLTHSDTERDCGKRDIYDGIHKWKDPLKLTVGEGKDCRHAGKNTCKLTLWAIDFAGNNGFGTEYMTERIYDIDFTPPTSKVEKTDPLPPYPAKPWYKSSFKVLVEDYDNLAGSGLDKCYYWLYNMDYSNVMHFVKGGTRDCSSWGEPTKAPIEITVGKDKDCPYESENPITKERERRCILYVYSIDKAGNWSDFYEVRYNIDYTKPFVK